MPESAESPADKSYRCSFCGRSEEAQRHLMFGPGLIIICDRCVGACNAMLAERRAQAEGRPIKRRKRPSGARRRRRATVVVGSDEAAALVRREYQIVLSQRRLSLSIINHGHHPAECYDSKAQFAREQWARLNAVSDFAVRSGLISRQQAREIIRDALDAHPDMDVPSS